MSKATIKQIRGYEIFDSRGRPTVGVRLVLTNGQTVQAAVPSGASTGKHEAWELRDGGVRLFGQGVKKAVKNINNIIAPVLAGRPVTDQAAIDSLLIALDGTPNKAKLGANAILAVSLAVARAGAVVRNMELFAYLSDYYRLPQVKRIKINPMLNVLNGGRHADNNLDIQEFMIVPQRGNFKNKMRIAAEVYQSLKKILQARKMSTGLGDEGGFAPNLSSNEEALRLLVRAISKSGYAPGRDVAIAIDAAASEFYRKGKYHFEGKVLSATELITIFAKWIRKYPIISIEDGLAEDDWQNWQKMTKQLGGKVMLVGDDLFVTNPQRLSYGISQGAANSILIKLNQIGTVTETIATINLAHRHKYKTIISHRSGETCDSFIADLAVASSAGFIKSGAPARSERLAKYNRLLVLEEFYF